MPDITKTLTIPEALVPELITVFGEGYNATIITIDENGDEVETPNPQTKQQFANERFEAAVKDVIRSAVVSYRKRQQRAALDTDFEATVA